jgi:hypothetical protein
MLHKVIEKELTSPQANQSETFGLTPGRFFSGQVLECWQKKDLLIMIASEKKPFLGLNCYYSFNYFISHLLECYTEIVQYWFFF